MILEGEDGKRGVARVGLRSRWDLGRMPWGYTRQHRPHLFNECDLLVWMGATLLDSDICSDVTRIVQTLQHQPTVASIPGTNSTRLRVPSTAADPARRSVRARFLQCVYMRRNCLPSTMNTALHVGEVDAATPSSRW